MVVGVVPVEGRAIEVATCENGRQVAAIHRLGRFRTDTRSREDRGGDVVSDHRHVARTPRLCDPRPGNDHRHPHPRLVGRSLAGPQGTIISYPSESAVIAGEEDHGLLPDAEACERLDDPPQGVINTRYHRGILRILGLLAGDLFGGVPRLHVRLALDRRMHAVVGQIEEEWLVAVSGDEPHRLGGLSIGEVFTVWSFAQVGNLIRGEVTGGLPPMVPSQVDIEALMLGIELRASKMPFADAGRGIASRSESLGQRRHLERQELCPLGRKQFGVG